MDHQQEIIDLQRRIDHLERLVRAGIATNQAAAAGLPDATDGTVFGQIPKTGTPPNELHGIPEALSTPELGTAAAGGGSIKVFTDIGKKVEIKPGAIIQADRSGTVFDFTHVNVITTSTTPPGGSGVKGQLHMIY
jgi:hypothetical protein